MTIAPLPPLAVGVGLPWDVPVDDPVAAIAAARRELGDTFVVDSGDDRYLFTFSPEGVAAFYALPEERASKGVADWRMLRRKLPDEVFVGRRTLPHQLFGRDDVATYLDNVDRALEATVAELGTSGEVDVFALTRRIGHRVGLASWGGPGAASGARFEQLVAALDTLDAAESFVHPDAMAAVAASGKAAERRALDVVEELIGEGLAELPGAEAGHPLFDRVAAAWADESPGERAAGVALDVTLIHVASMSNLFAALGWALVDLLEHPAEVERLERATGRGPRRAPSSPPGWRSARSWPATCWHPSASTWAARPSRCPPASPSPRCWRSRTPPRRRASTPGSPTAGTGAVSPTWARCRCPSSSPPSVTVATPARRSPSRSRR